MQTEHQIQLAFRQLMGQVGYFLTMRITTCVRLFINENGIINDAFFEKKNLKYSTKVGFNYFIN